MLFISQLDQNHQIKGAHIKSQITEISTSLKNRCRCIKFTKIISGMQSPVFYGRQIKGFHSNINRLKHLILTSNTHIHTCLLLSAYQCHHHTHLSLSSLTVDTSCQRDLYLASTACHKHYTLHLRRQQSQSPCPTKNITQSAIFPVNSNTVSMQSTQCWLEYR